MAVAISSYDHEYTFALNLDLSSVIRTSSGNKRVQSIEATLAATSSEYLRNLVDTSTTGIQGTSLARTDTRRTLVQGSRTRIETAAGVSVAYRSRGCQSRYLAGSVSQ